MFLKNEGQDSSSEWITRVKDLMLKKGIQTCQDLAYHSGVSAGSLNQALRGMHMPKQVTIEKIATALNTTPQYLLYGDNLRVIKKVPFLNSPSQVGGWVKDKKTILDSIEWIDFPSTSKMPTPSFATKLLNTDMEPLFQPGDILIFNSVDNSDFIHERKGLAHYILTLEYGRDFKPLKCLFGILSLTNSGMYLDTIDKRFTPMPIEGNCKIVGVLVYQMRDYSHYKRV
ncbi:helix-turn-helix domain-containing protein [Sansalvadorimonas sp. 2012CJ34-2]|uniref:Helix-turn-helix domain-containing protein n=1 Tax=Parendozoicomonas callyspongiae TaxID=2942213 RepID=A0ABT0PFU2_9GAMM|nr:helix-turn-helix transcriptional regulator [Sansalvadorimonas sp. 2012CJ34-2]MCL6269398.1 helix-turn-helix domain-containing protein [Sansalvadorimonas sp. 2012CJ34-2]